MKHNQPIILVILDGFGYSPRTEYNAIAQADTPTLDFFFTHYPHTFLHASGSAVGLPEEYAGNSQVGHLTIGAGRIIVQPITRINHAISTEKLATDTQLHNHLIALQEHKGSLHIIGIASDGGVHGHINHMKALIEIAASYQHLPIYIHAILDGRDCPPISAATYLEQLETIIQKHPQIHLGSICGRFYAMDRALRWDRTNKYYQMLISSSFSHRYTNWHEVLHDFYSKGITDEFIPPIKINFQATLKDNDGIIVTNIRPDRTQQLIELLMNPRNNHDPHLSWLITLVPIIDTPRTISLMDIQPAFHGLLETLAYHNKSIILIAEKEKEVPITAFLNGGNYPHYPRLSVAICPSLSVEQFSTTPEMSAQCITDTLLDNVKKNNHDLYIINYANADMVGHSGNLSATIRAIEYLDTQLARIFDAIKQHHGILIITADHGKAEDLCNIDAHQPLTAHTTNPVPFIVVSNQPIPPLTSLKTLADIAPYILTLMQVPVPPQMTGHHHM